MARPTHAASLPELAAALKHDLGKYVAWRSANFSDAQWDDAHLELVQALQADVLSTRSGGAHGPRAAWEVFADGTADLSRPWPAPELERVEAAVLVLREHGEVLRRGDRAALRPVLPQLREAQTTIRTALRDLVRRIASEGG